MEFNVKSGSPEKQRVSSVLIGVYEGRRLSLAADLVDRISNGYLSHLLRRGEMEGKLGSTLILPEVPHTLCDRIILVGLGKEKLFKEAAFRTAIRASTQVLLEGPSSEVASYLTELPFNKKGIDSARAIEIAAQVVEETCYRFEATRQEALPTRLLRKMIFCVSRRNELASAEAALKRGLAIASGVNTARTLGNLPPNICTPTYLAQHAIELAETFSKNIKCSILDQKAIEDLKMGGLLTVAKGSIEPPQFIVLEYKGTTKEQKPYVLVGKGITFDSGGISLKPGEGMDEMRYDMCGAAAVLGTLRSVAELELAINLVVLVPTCENMPSGHAARPGDVIQTLSGLTVEVLNTDAEGRLILCDALTYAKQFEPEAIIDVATLTGACVIALGHVTTGVFSNEDDLARALVDAGDNTGDLAWQMPLFEDYHEQIKTHFADLANVGGRPAGSITAACFLSRFVDEKTPWAHLDIAGTAWKSGKEKGATGRPVSLLTRFFMQEIAQQRAKAEAPRRGRPPRVHNEFFLNED